MSPPKLTIRQAPRRPGGRGHDQEGHGPRRLRSAEGRWRIVGAHLASLNRKPWFGTMKPRLVMVIGSDARPGQNPPDFRADSLHVVGAPPEEPFGGHRRHPRVTPMSPAPRGAPARSPSSCPIRAPDHRRYRRADGRDRSRGPRAHRIRRLHLDGGRDRRIHVRRTGSHVGRRIAGLLRRRRPEVRRDRRSRLRPHEEDAPLGATSTGRSTRACSS